MVSGDWKWIVQVKSGDWKWVVQVKGGVKRLNNHSPNIRTYNLQHLSP